MKHHLSKYRREIADAWDERIERTRTRTWVRVLISSVLVTALVAYLLLGVVFGSAVVQGDSMAPELHDGDIVIYYRLGSTYQKNDIVLMHGAGSNENIKRIVGLPGDEIDIDESAGRAVVNGEIDNDGFWGDTYARPDGLDLPLTLADGEYWVFGDNRTVALDSRSFGPINERQIDGRVCFVLRFS